MAWNPEDTSSGGSGDIDIDDDAGGSAPGSASEGDETGGLDPTGDELACAPGDERQCLCDDGLHLGIEVCLPGGDRWGPCECGDDPTGGQDPTGGPGDETGGDETTGGDDLAPIEVCFPGGDGSYSTCFGLHYVQPAGYDYPPALNGDANYRQPIAFIDLEQADGSTLVSPNFRLDEIAQIVKGRYAIVQPHAVESLQRLRDDVGAINVNSGYRSPDYNDDVGGATHSRHMYGDGFDLDPVSVGLSTLESACTDRGGMLVEYETHVHCDFRFDDVDHEFFGTLLQGGGDDPVLAYEAAVEQDHGVFMAPAQGFDEGEPLRRWSAFDADGQLLDTQVGPVFVAPFGTYEVRVRIGAQLERTVLVD